MTLPPDEDDDGTSPNEAGVASPEGDGVPEEGASSAVVAGDGPVGEAPAPVPSEGFDPATDPGITESLAPVVAAAEAAVEVAPETRLPSILESLVLAADRPLSTADLAELVGERERSKVDAALRKLAEEYASRGIQLHAVAGGWQFRTDPRNAPWVGRLLTQKPVRLTRAQLEVMAIVAYRQPITRPEIDEIRGVDSGGTLKTLLDRSLLRILGKKEEPGRPMLYGTTREFLEFFNLKDLKDLPTLREYHELTGEGPGEAPGLAAVAAAQAGTAEAERPPPPLERVELPEDLQADLGELDEMIRQATEKAQAVERQLAAEIAPPGAAPAGGAPPPRSENE
ncbi:MAG TPA: SMC-Scp complex subunit ScpB [Polyangia bacterium]|jgi:segregation and condensation protein B|nr:SMC-Scp complex subunit ScpB [Polyangia bacterium]